MNMELLAQIFEVCIIPLLGVLTAFFVKWVNAKSAELIASRKNETEQKYLNMLKDTITDCVIATYTTNYSTSSANRTIKLLQTACKQYSQAERNFRKLLYETRNKLMTTG